MSRALLLCLLAAACLPVPTDLIGKECDAFHACGRGLFCVDGRCAVDPAPALVPPAAGGAGGGGVAGGGGAGAGAAGGASASACDAGSAELDCSNGRDDDCDGLVDCADPSCATRACDAANPAAVCCGAGPAAACRDLSADPFNCGSCGAACAAGETCRGISSGGAVTGRCSCMADSACPAPSGDDQSCVATHCSCDEDGECGTGQRCEQLGATGSPGICRY